MIYKLAIVGSRTFLDLEAVRSFVRQVHATGENVEIVSGGAQGVDKAAELEARRLGMPVKIFAADWNTHGRSAGYKRNVEIVAYSDEIVAYWDGVSSGTKHTIDIAQSAGKHYTVKR